MTGLRSHGSVSLLSLLLLLLEIQIQNRGKITEGPRYAHKSRSPLFPRGAALSQGVPVADLRPLRLSLGGLALLAGALIHESLPHGPLGVCSEEPGGLPRVTCSPMTVIATVRRRSSPRLQELRPPWGRLPEPLRRALQQWPQQAPGWLLSVSAFVSHLRHFPWAGASQVERPQLPHVSNGPMSRT